MILTFKKRNVRMPVIIRNKNCITMQTKKMEE